MMVRGYVLPILKPEWWTSHDAVQKLRGVLGVREIGHGGSLDPFATGVLLCGVGRGTKVLGYLQELTKDYVGLMHLGRITDTGDPTGRVLEERPVRDVTLDRARSIAGNFVGVRDQVPPMVSAVKHQGRRLYELARKGIEVERAARSVEIHAFEILGVSNDRLEFRVLCGKGTYVRTLAQEFGESLGPGASLEQLRRRAVGSFDETAAIAIDDEPARVRAACADAVVPLASAVGHLPSLTLKTDWVRKVRQGAQPPWRAVGAESLPVGERFRLIGPEGDLIAIAGLAAIPGPAERGWQDSWELRLDRVL
jgi:tRNA pseudouridine55 synthase